MTEENSKYTLLAHQIEHEKTLSKLYKKYSELFPAEQVWKTLESEEKKHADWIQQIITKVCDGTIFFKDRHECCEIIRESIELIKSEIEKAGTENISLKEAFSAAIEIEDSMVEREFFKSLESDAPFIQDVLSRIVEDTEEHKQILIDAKDEFLKTLE